MNRADLQLIAELSDPDRGVVEALSRMEGDLVVLGAGGKMGFNLALMAHRAFQEAGKANRVMAVSRFASDDQRQAFESEGIHTHRAELTDAAAVRDLPDAPNVLHLTGVKFGTGDNPGYTWLINVHEPALIAQRYCDSQIVALSSGNVYPLTSRGSGDVAGATEDTPLNPVGEYGQTVVGRERMFQHFSQQHGTPVCVVRLNYAIEPRYGVLTDLARKVQRGEPIDLSMGYVNIVWTTDANRVILKCFDLATSPPKALNLTGPTVLSVRELANQFADIFGSDPVFTGEESPTALLSDASECWKRFGPPEATLEYMVHRVAEWLMQGLPVWDKPTHFEVRSGQF